MSMQKHLIIVADDYGIRETSAPTLALVEAGVIDRVAVLVRFVSGTDVQRLVKTGVKIDIHLELIRLLGRGEYEGDSSLKRLWNFVWHVLRGDVTPRTVGAEWREQIALFQKQFGHLPDGMNSHEHVHFFPLFFLEFLKIAQEHGIQYIRFGSRRVLGSARFRVAQTVISILHKLNRYFSRNRSFLTSDYLTSVDWIDDAHRFVRDLPSGRIELVAHPERPYEAALLRILRKGVDRE